MFGSSVSYAVIGVVAKKKDYSIQSLHQHLQERWVSVSLPNFYKIIARMVDDQILIKAQGRVQLHSLFLRYLFGLTKATENIYKNEKSELLQTLEPGQQKTWHEASLYELNAIRTDLLAQIVKMHPGSDSYHYASHPYFLLSTPEKEKIAMEELAGSLGSSFLLLGNETVLDRYACQLLARELYTSACTSTPPFPSEGYFVDIIGDYILECMVPQAVSDIFTMIFMTIVREEWYKKWAFLQVLKMKVPCSLKLIYSPDHAKKLSLKIANQCKREALWLKMTGKSV